MKTMKKILCIFLVVLMCLTSTPLGGFLGLELSNFTFARAIDEADSILSGTCGENAFWSFDESTGTLSISGTGKIDDAFMFDEETGDILYDEVTGELVLNMPWYDFKNQVVTLIIEEGITEIGSVAFYSLYYLTQVEFPSTLETVGYAAFCDCIRLEELDFPHSVKTLYCSNYNEIAIKKIVLPESLEATPSTAAFKDEDVFDFNMCVYLESLTVPEEIGAIEAIISPVNPAIRNIYNYSTEALVKFDCGGVSEGWWGDEATAEYMTVAMGAALESIEYEMTEEDLQKFVLQKIIEYYGEDYTEKVPEPIMSETVSDYINVYCYENSAQHTYCIENNINYTLITDDVHLDSDNDGICDICGKNNMCGEKVYYELDDSTGTLTLKGEGETYSYEWLEAPFSYMNDINKVVVEEGITTLGNTIFQKCSFESISLPHSLKKIGDVAFDNCDLKVLYLYENLEYIGQDVFRECYDLEKIIVDSNNLYYFSDDSGALYNKGKTELIHYPAKSSTAEYSIPETVISFSSYAFADCENLKILNIHSAVTYIESNFYACKSIEKFVVAEDNLVYSSDERGVLFDKDKTLLIKYPEGNKEIKYTVPDSVITIGELSIHMCDYLEELYIGDDVSYIEIGALSRNAALRKIEVAENNLNYCTDEDGVLFNKDKSILYQYTTGHPRKIYTIPNTVTKLSACSFEDSVNLNTSIVIPSSVTHIEDWVFPAERFDFIYYTGTEEQWNSIQIDGFNYALVASTILFNYDGTTPVLMDNGYCGDNITYSLYSDGSLIIEGEGDMWDYEWVDHDGFGMPEYMTWAYEEIDGEMCIVGDKNIKKIVIKDGVTRIGNRAFQACRNLEEVEIADTVTSIGNVAFDYCTSLKHIKIPGSVKVIEQEAFSESALETIEIENGLEEIEMIAFLYCQNLKEILIPESVTYIGDCAFIICDSLETVVVNNKVCEIGAGNFVTFELDEDGYPIEDENGFEMFDGIKYRTTECQTMVKGYIGSTAEAYTKEMTEAGYPIKFEALDAHVHTPVTYTQETTCTVNGYVLTSCATCTETLGYEVLTAPGHTAGEEVSENVVASTCTEHGSYDRVVYCTVCTAELSRRPIITDLLEHDFSINVTVTKPTLVSEGKAYYECSRCGEKEYYTIPVLEGTVSWDSDSDVSVEYLGGTYNGNMQVKVEEDFTGSQYLTQSYTKFESWNIKTYVDGNEIQPSAPVLVSIPLPTDYNAATVAVYHVNSMTGKLEKMAPLYFENGYVKFLTDSFSVYMVVDESSVEVHNHKDNNHDGKCDGCDYDFTSGCSCNCHKGGIAGFFFKIILFFQKIFKTNKECKCGIYHY